MSTDNPAVARATRVMDIMTRRPIVVGPEVSVDEVLAVFQEASIRHLPVVDEEGLLGMVTRRDLQFIHALPGVYQGIDEPQLRQILDFPVGVMMKSRFLVNRDVITLRPEEAVKRAADLIIANGVGALPVVDPDGQVVGILSAIDILRWLSDELLD